MKAREAHEGEGERWKAHSLKITAEIFRPKKKKEKEAARSETVKARRTHQGERKRWKARVLKTSPSKKAGQEAPPAEGR